MTIIVGVLCSDGIVIAADGMASNNLGSTSFVGINNLKTEIIQNKLIVSCAGDDSLMTLFINYLKSDNLSSLVSNSDEFAFSIINGFHAYCENLYLKPIKNGTPGQVLNDVPIDPIKYQLVSDFYSKVNQQFAAIIAFEYNGHHFAYTLNGFQPPQMIRDGGIWYKIIGSGGLIGWPSIHLIKNILNIKTQPSVENAIQLAYWTIDHSIEASSGGIGGEIKITKLEKAENNTYKIENVDVTGTKEYINDMYQYIHKFVGDNITTTKAPTLPT